MVGDGGFILHDVILFLDDTLCVEDVQVVRVAGEGPEPRLVSERSELGGPVILGHSAIRPIVHILGIIFVQFVVIVHVVDASGGLVSLQEVLFTGGKSIVGVHHKEIEVTFRVTFGLPCSEAFSQPFLVGVEFEDVCCQCLNLRLGVVLGRNEVEGQGADGVVYVDVNLRIRITIGGKEGV